MTTDHAMMALLGLVTFVVVSICASVAICSITTRRKNELEQQGQNDIAIAKERTVQIALEKG